MQGHGRQSPYFKHVTAREFQVARNFQEFPAILPANHSTPSKLIESTKATQLTETSIPGHPLLYVAQATLNASLPSSLPPFPQLRRDTMIVSTSRC